MDYDNWRIIELLPTDCGPTTMTLNALILSSCIDAYDYMKTSIYIRCINNLNWTI